MFDLSNAYSGVLVTQEEGAEGPIPIDSPNHSYHIDPEQIILHARQEAADILEQAHAEAEALKRQAVEEVKAQAEFQIAAIANTARKDLGIELWSAKDALVDILEDALLRMIGRKGDTQPLYLAITQAACDYTSAQTFTLYAEPETANRLRIVHMSEAKNQFSERFEIVDDFGIDAGSCILDMGNKRVEVSLAAQIQAMKSSVAASLSNVPVASDTLNHTSVREL